MFWGKIQQILCKKIWPGSKAREDHWPTFWDFVHFASTPISDSPEPIFYCWHMKIYSENVYQQLHHYHQQDKKMPVEPSYLELWGESLIFLNGQRFWKLWPSLTTSSQHVVCRGWYVPSYRWSTCSTVSTFITTPRIQGQLSRTSMDMWVRWICYFNGFYIWLLQSESSMLSIAPRWIFLACWETPCIWMEEQVEEVWIETSSLSSLLWMITYGSWKSSSLFLKVLLLALAGALYLTSCSKLPQHHPCKTHNSGKNFHTTEPTPEGVAFGKCKTSQWLLNKRKWHCEGKEFLQTKYLERDWGEGGVLFLAPQGWERVKIYFSMSVNHTNPALSQNPVVHSK